MRDSIQTREYFDVFILEETDRVRKFEEKIKSGTLKPDRILPVKDKLLQIKIGIIIAKYSRGDSVEILKKEFISLIDLFFESWNRDSYEDNLRFASLCYLFDVDEEIKNRIGEKLKEIEYYDSIINFILYGSKEVGTFNTVSFPESYSKLVDVIITGNIKILEEYLHSWYDDHYDSAWFDSHKSTKVNVYYGYWCFEAGAIAKRLGLKDDDLQKEQYYPYDMVHFVK